MYIFSQNSPFYSVYKAMTLLKTHKNPNDLNLGGKCISLSKIIFVYFFYFHEELEACFVI